MYPQPTWGYGLPGFAALGGHPPIPPAQSGSQQVPASAASMSAPRMSTQVPAAINAVPAAQPQAPTATPPVMTTPVTPQQMYGAATQSQLGARAPSLVQSPANLNSILQSLNTMSTNIAAMLSQVNNQGLSSSQPPLGQGQGSGFASGGAQPCALQALAGQGPPLAQQPPQWQQTQQPQVNFGQQPPPPQANNNNGLFPSSQVSLAAFPGVPARFITQIQRGEFVNFDSLYSAIVYGASSKQGYSLVMDDKAESDTPTVSILKQTSEKGKVKNFSAWLRAWNTFMVVFLHFRPHMVSQLISYQNSVTQLASTYFLQYWLAYDAAFRQKMANNPFLRWDLEDNFLFNSYLRSAPVLAAATLPVSSPAATPANKQPQVGKSYDGKCYNCGTYGHFLDRCPYASTQATQAPPRAGAPSQAHHMPAAGAPPAQNSVSTPPFRAPQRHHAGTGGDCFNWNNGQPCPPGCQRMHKCSFCNKLHARCECKSYREYLAQNPDASQ